MSLVHDRAAATVAVQGNMKVLWFSFLAFSLGFAIWGMFSALGPFLIQWYHFSPSQALFLAAMPPLFATLASIPLGIAADRFGGRRVFSLTLLVISLPLLGGLFVESYAGFLLLGLLLGLGGATFVIGNAHVSSWYPKSRQGTALGLYALGNFGISIGMILVPYLITQVLGGPEGYAALPAKVHLGMFSGWRLIFLFAAIPTLIMAFCYWRYTSDPQVHKTPLTLGEIAKVYKSGALVWIVAYLYWTSFGTLTFFSALTPTYLVDRWGVNANTASMVFTALLVLFVAFMRPIGGWLSDRRDPLKMLSWMFAGSIVCTVVLMMELSLVVQIFAIYAMAMISGAASATVVKLIPTYFKQVGAVSGLAKAAGAACGFTMTVTMAMSKKFTGDYTLGFTLWAAMNVLAFYFSFSRRGFPQQEPEDELVLQPQAA